MLSRNREMIVRDLEDFVDERVFPSGLWCTRKEDQVQSQLVLIQKRTRLEFLRRRIGRLYTQESVNMDKETCYKYKETHVIDE